MGLTPEFPLTLSVETVGLTALLPTEELVNPDLPNSAPASGLPVLCGVPTANPDPGLTPGFTAVPLL